MPGKTMSRDSARNTKPVETILISQPEPPKDKRNPYNDLAEKWGIKVDFRKFIEIQDITAKEFRKYRTVPTDYSAIIFTSRLAIRHFFRICQEMRITMPQETKYFCSSEMVGLYLQNYIEYRKRKVFYPKKDNKNTLFTLLDKHKGKEKFLFPCANNRKNDIPLHLETKEFDFSEVQIYKVVCSDLSDLKDIYYDMIVFFTPLGITSLFENFPDFEQKKTRMAAWGTTTHDALVGHDLELDVSAPLPELPSMTMAIEDYLRKVNK